MTRRDVTANDHGVGDEGMEDGVVDDDARSRVPAAVDTVVLDLGQVLVSWEPHRAHPHLSAGEWNAVADEIDFPSYNLRADAGESWGSLEAEVAARWPQHAGFLARYVEAFPATLVGPVAGTAEVLAELREAGVRLLGLTNWSAETFPHGVGAAPWIGELEAVVVSGEIGLVKPDPAIFAHLVATHAVDPGRALFVDDRVENVAAAEREGFHGHVFTAAPGLRRALRALGVPVRPGARARRLDFTR